MLQNYFKIVWRTIRNHKAFSVLNIFGLALGIACSLLIFLWVRDEKSIGLLQANNKGLYILYERETVDGKKQAGYWTPGLLATELKKKIPEIKYATDWSNEDGANFDVNGKALKQSGLYADSDFFQMFNYSLLEGNAASALNSPSTIALSEAMAQRFFGSAQAAIGKTIRFEARRNFTVSAVFANPTSFSSQKFDFVINWMAHLEDNGWLKDWSNNSPSTVVLLHPQANTAAVEKKLKKFLFAYHHDFNSGFSLELGLQPFQDAYLHSNFVDGEISGGRIEYVRLFSIVAIFILVIACINFMNLTTARAAKRSKEIGIRKVAGAVRGILVRQFLSEAVLIAAGATIIALLMVNGALPFFNTLTGKEILFPFASYAFWLALAGLILVTGLLAGSYPALFLSAFQPIQVLKGSLKSSWKSILFRRGLVVFQFVLSIVLIIGTIVVARQVSYVQHANLGYDKENLVYLPLEGKLAKQYSLFKQQALGIPGVQAVAYLSDAPSYIGGNITGTVSWTGKQPGSNQQVTVTATGYDFVKTMRLTILQGRDFSRDFAGDSAGYLLNEEAVALTGYKDPIGQPFELWGRKGKIIGVLKNFHLTDLHQRIPPLVVHLDEANEGGCILVRTNRGDTKVVLAGLKSLCSTINPQFPFSYLFTDEAFLKLYKSEEVVSNLSDCFAALAIIISCMGLLGLAMYRVELRTKEIGIRKVLGAGIFSILTLLTGEFLLLVLFALVIASPLAWWAMQTWLQGYAYRTVMEWWIFGLAGVIALAIALLTIGFQAVKAALGNPVKSLRAE